VLGFSIVSALYERYPELHEGQLSRVRADVVSRRACAQVARELALGDRVRAGVGNDSLKTNQRVLAAILESTLGALYLAFGIDAIRVAIADAFMPQIEASLTEGPDPKTRLQEHMASLGSSVHYVTLTTEGPPHDPVFTVAAVVNEVEAGKGTGRSKKDAEQEAAKAVLAAFEEAAPS
jgi:ribonuclease III